MLYHADIKMQRKYIPFVVINNIKWIMRYIMLRLNTAKKKPDALIWM